MGFGVVAVQAQAVATGGLETQPAGGQQWAAERVAKKRAVLRRQHGELIVRKVRTLFILRVQVTTNT